MHRAAYSFALLASAAVTVSAQRPSRTDRFIDNCNNWGGGDRYRERYCETREIDAPVSKSLSVDGRDNGGVTVHGWDRNQIHLVAMVHAEGETEADARDIAKNVTISTSNGEVRASGPSVHRRYESWSVSYEIWVPRHTDLSLDALNGGLSVDGVDAKMDLETTNGGLNLADVAGDVRGTTVNGGVTAELSGDRWRGQGLDLRTSNGGVHLYIPDNYSARLETGTVNGGMDIGFPVTVQGSFGRRLTTTLGGGGATIRAVTTNGGVSIRRR